MVLQFPVGKKQIADYFNINPRTVDYWLAKARNELGANFPGTRKGSISFSEADYRAFEAYIPEKYLDSVGQPYSDVLEPVEVIDPAEILDLEDGYDESSSLVRVDVGNLTRLKSYKDTVGLEAETRKYEGLSVGFANMLAEDLAQHAKQITKEARAQIDNAVAASTAKALHDAVEGME